MAGGGLCKTGSDIANILQHFQTFAIGNIIKFLISLILHGSSHTAGRDCEGSRMSLKEKQEVSENPAEWNQLGFFLREK